MIEPIVIKVTDKVPELVSGPQYVVCDNSDYTVVWQLDEEWAQFEHRTMQVNYKDGTYERVLFTGDSCALPAIPVPGPVHVGLFAGDIHTTRPARLLAVRSATTDSGEERDPTPNGYAQAIQALDAKLDKNQGAENAGKALVVDAEGNVVAGEGGGVETDPTVPAWAKQPAKPTYTADEVGADARGAAVGAVSAHNTAADAHSDIRLLVEGLTTRLNALANSDDTTLDQMAEVVAYIKANRELIESVTTAKVNVTDIIDNLTTNASNKPLSAAQGVALKALIDAIDIPDAYTLPVASSTQLGGVKPAAKTDEMTQPVGVDEDGALYTKPGEASASVQSDWSQNDETAADYVKNRPGGYDVQDVNITWDGEVGDRLMVEVDSSSQSSSSFVRLLNEAVAKSRVLGGTITISAVSVSGEELGTNTYVITESMIGGETENFQIVVRDNNFVGIVFVVASPPFSEPKYEFTLPEGGVYFSRVVYNDAGMIYLSSLTFSPTPVKIPQKYLDLDGYAQEDDAILSTPQTLTDAQKQQARANIGLAPVAKTDAMTQSVGLDAETGRLWTVPPTGDNIVLASSTTGSTKKFRITVDDSGTLSAVEVTDAS